VSEIGRRLERLEVLAGGGVDETDGEREERLRDIRQGAVSANDRALRGGRIPPFVIEATGYVVCSQDGRPVATSHQVSAEDWYMRELESSYGHLIHDAEEETFRTHEGDLALSRDVVDIRYLIPDRPL
jgi:hypothetical protein